MNYLIWKLHRNQVRVAIAALLILAVVLITSGIHMSRVYRAALVACAGNGACSDLQNTLFQGDGLILDLVLATLVIPFLLGMFWGAPLLSRDLEEGTHNLVWTQSITRKHWFSVNVIWALFAASVYGAAISALVTWWRALFDTFFWRGRMSPLIFDLQGVVPIAYSIFAVSLGVASGAWFRRVVPAMATTLGLLVAIRVVILLYVRPHYLAPLHASLSLTLGKHSAGSANGWELSRNIADASGHLLGNDLMSVPSACHESLFDGSVMNCLAQHGYQRLVTYQPESRFWTCQGIESGLFGCLAALALGVAYWRITRRDA
jgi:hypothetical protein